MRPGVVIDPATALPRVVAVRTVEGELAFAYETRRAGGMAVLVDIQPEDLNGARTKVDPTDLAREIEKAAKGVARNPSIAGAAVPEAYGMGSVPEERGKLGEPPPEPGLSEAEAAELKAREAAALARVEELEDALSGAEVDESLAERLEAAEARAAEAEARAAQVETAAKAKPARSRPSRAKAGATS